MKTMLLIVLCAVGGFLTSTLQAQVSLPYYSGFDTQDEREGWTKYKLAEPIFGEWSIAGIGGFSLPSCISHDYSPSSGAEVVDDWFVSPGFFIPSGGILDSVRYAFSGFSVPTTGDTIGVYLILGHQDPALATSVIELADFRDATFQNDNVYRLLTGITLPATNEMAFIGMRYRNADASSRWLYVRFDNISVSESTTAIDVPHANQKTFVIYPNPTTDQVTINHNETGGVVFLYDQRGLQLCKYQLSNSQASTTLSLSKWPQGLYHVVLQSNTKMESATIARI